MLKLALVQEKRVGKGRVHTKLISLLESGYRLLNENQISQAISLFDKVLDADPNNEFALNLLGVCYLRLANPARATEFLTAAISINPNDSETYNNLGLAYKDLKQLKEAQSCFEKSLSLNAAQPVTLNNLGNVYSGLEAHDDAIRCFESAVKLAPNYAEAFCNLAQSLKALSKLELALNAINRACQLNTESSQFINVKGEIYLALTDYQTAMMNFQKAIEIDGNLVAQVNLSTVQKQLGKPEEAEQTLLKVIKIEPNNSEAHNHYGVLLEQLGRFDEAALCFRNALKYTPNHASSFYQLAKLKNHGLTDDEFNTLKRLVLAPEMPSVFKVSFYFALAIFFDKKKDFYKAFEYYSKAQEIKASKVPYKEYITQAYVQEMRRLMPMPSVRYESNGNDFQPVFVVGMPRSGTSLVEQILSSHSQIFGAGELSVVSEVVKQAEQITQSRFPSCVTKLNLSQLEQLGQRYRKKLIDTFGKQQIIIDKNPLNFNFVGFIKAILPTSKFIFCKRNAIDNCVSIFKLPFDDNQSYAHDLRALGHYYKSHVQLMDFWLELFPNDIIQVNYEDMVGAQRTETGRICQFLHIDYEQQMDRFYETKRIVMTPSAEQVRQPIYTSSINSWKKYGDAVLPLVDSLS